MSNLLLCVGLICGSIIWVEIVRDSYHALAHHWQPLYRLHVWHHRVFRPDLSVMSEEIYRRAHWYNDVPEALVMLAASVLPVLLAYSWGFDRPWLGWLGSLYTLTFLSTAIGRGLGIANLEELTDLTHRPGQFESLPAQWRVNRTYHWRHHFDNQKAYYCGTFTFMDKLMGTALSLKGKTIAITGANGTLGRSLLKYLQLKGAKVIALTSRENAIAIEINGESVPVKTVKWQIGEETQLEDLFRSVAEAEVNPAFSPLYELSKRAIGDMITLRRLDAPCVVRKLILGPFKSNLNPLGIMSADWVAKQIIKAVQRDSRNIIITINPLTFITFPIKEFSVSTYLKLFTRSPKNRENP